MALTLCSNCRLPVNTSAQNCPLCGVVRSQPATQRHVPLAAATIAVVALALVARRLA
jgi:hypothetical protein